VILGLAEILKNAAALPTTEKRIAFLRQHDCVPLRRILRYAFDERVKWLFPEDWHPSWKPLPKDQHIGAELMMLKEIRTCYLFLEGDDDRNPNVTMEKRQKLYTELLENVLPDDAELLVAARKRTLPYPTITKELAQATFPGLVV
jgi:hypothetical protein